MDVFEPWSGWCAWCKTRRCNAGVWTDCSEQEYRENLPTGSHGVCPTCAPTVKVELEARLDEDGSSQNTEFTKSGEAAP